MKLDKPADELVRNVIPHAPFRERHFEHPHWLAMDFPAADDGFGNLVRIPRSFSFYVVRFMDEDLH